MGKKDISLARRGAEVPPAAIAKTALADCAAGASARPFCPDCPGGIAARTMITET
jgi:hypothetical protein